MFDSLFIVGLAQMIRMPENWKWNCFDCAETLSISPQPIGLLKIAAVSKEDAAVS